MGTLFRVYNIKAHVAHLHPIFVYKGAAQVGVLHEGSYIGIAGEGVCTKRIGQIGREAAHTSLQIVEMSTCIGRKVYTLGVVLKKHGVRPYSHLAAARVSDLNINTKLLGEAIYLRVNKLQVVGAWLGIQHIHLNTQPKNSFVQFIHGI